MDSYVPAFQDTPACSAEWVRNNPTYFTGADEFIISERL